MVGAEGLQFSCQFCSSKAFNLYCNGTPSVGDYEAEEDQLKECQYYTVEDLFCCGYARYFWEAIKIRYPEYCFYKDWEDMYAEN